MVSKIGAPLLADVVEALCEEESYQSVYHMPEHDRPMPSLEALSEFVERLRAVIFPGYFGDSEIQPETMRYHIGGNLDVAYRILVEQILRGHCFFCKADELNCFDCESDAKRIASEFMSKLPEMRKLLATDVQAAYVGDPASKSPGETIFCYPSITALTHHRIAHELYKLNVDLIPRIIGEMAHSKTGIDIHPGARIGEHFFIDHGTGTVIGETCIIGRNVRLYQGVTLGAKSFPQDESGTLIKGIARHPIVEDNVIVYSGATILGRVTIGAGSVIGGNVWVTRSIPAGERLLQSK
ncbi:serine O-acetyltransferase EpsC [Maridesulfovibrio hydrothermalis]|uniref:serine O-acetyltransferase n=1 Tax=Maridesulfovibrio hydrothermalis AM13 = DSM 14728 TaxID=1121451 RepID=L0R9H7_9BACT|nr:serine O-acetyltransferase EpsC [Maridesulfovibrio hydrothermalis]CCO22872.1 Serine acetyltransferase, plasmid [Maridesulfovibrio hydrothermalis AM13 = DSM 14728]